MKLNKLLEFDNIVIQCHDFPDADAVAAGFGVYCYLSSHHKKVRLVYSGAKEISKPNMLIMIKQLEIPIEYVRELDFKPELLITVDCIFGERNVHQLDAYNIAVIDHHIRGTSLPPLNEVRSSYGSCSTVIAKMLADEGYDIRSNERLSTALYYGLFMDTNAFSELGHPADKDLRDFSVFDRQLINILRNSNLTCDEMEIAGDALKNCKYEAEYALAMVEAHPCDPNILGFISDLLLQVNTIDHCIVYCRFQEGCKLSVRSCTNRINAAELAKHITSEVGNGGGHLYKAGGFISASLIPGDDIPMHIRSRLLSYHNDTDILYSGKSIADTSAMQLFRKKKIVVGYVPSTDIAAAGTEMTVRMLEGDINIRSDENVYLMVGILGEVYPISREVFEGRYVCTDRLPDMDLYEYPPSVIEKYSESPTALAEYIKGCAPPEEVTVYAKELTRGTKIFTEWDKESYIYGAAGDHLAAKSADGKDIYIIKRKIFSMLYELV